MLKAVIRRYEDDRRVFIARERGEEISGYGGASKVGDKGGIIVVKT